jgi:hypothetical protein
MPLARMAIKILRQLPHSRSFDRRLDDCAALYVFGYLGEKLPALRLAHIFGFVALPRLYPAGSNPMIQGAESTDGGTSNVTGLRRQ